MTLEELFANSGLPKDCDKHFENDLLLKIRHLWKNRRIWKCDNLEIWKYSWGVLLLLPFPISQNSDYIALLYKFALLYFRWFHRTIFTFDPFEDWITDLYNYCHPRPIGYCFLSEPSSADGFRAAILPWVARFFLQGDAVPFPRVSGPGIFRSLTGVFALDR